MSGKADSGAMDNSSTASIAPPSLAPPPLALYLHWPFCRAKCPYCDFNSHVATQIDHAAFAAAYRQEMSHMASLYGRGRRLHSLFLGGGTPSLMPPSLVEEIIEMAETLFGFEAGIEITLEANPTSSEANNLAGMVMAGVNRFSLGVQSLDDAGLAFLGREHSAAEALAALDAARQLVSRLSIDLIYARTGQDAAAWRAELQSALSIGLDHMSLYQLTIEPGTGFFTRSRAGETLVASDDLAADLYDMTADMMESAGLPAYEVSNHARAGQESRHNLVYWRAQDWIGVGPGAHGRITDGHTRIGTATRRSPQGWLEDVRTKGHGIETEIRDHGDDVLAEHLMMGLRLTEGVDLVTLAQRIGHQDPFTGRNPLLDRDVVERLVALCLLEWRDNARLAVTSKGRLVLNSIIAELLPQP